MSEWGGVGWGVYVAWGGGNLFLERSARFLPQILLDALAYKVHEVYLVTISA